MAELNFFRYQSGNSLLFRLNPSAKLLVLLSLSITISFQKLSGLLLIGLFIESFTGSLNLKWQRIKKELIFFSVLITLVFIFQANAFGLRTGFIKASRLVLILTAGIMITTTTAPHEWQQALYKLLKPFPFLKPARTAAGISLMITFIPELFYEYQNIHEAWLSRGGNSSHNILSRIKDHILPYMEGLFQRAELLADSMITRAYEEDSTIETDHFNKEDKYFIAFSVILLIVLPLLISFYERHILV